MFLFQNELCDVSYNFSECVRLPRSCSAVREDGRVAAPGARETEKGLDGAAEHFGAARTWAETVVKTGRRERKEEIDQMYMVIMLTVMMALLVMMLSLVFSVYVCVYVY